MMVGVPGKSKGCSTCRRRKKGCDTKRPACGQCLASGYVCGGYQRDLTFILHPTSKVAESAVFLPVRPAPHLLTLLPSLERSAVVSQCRNLFFDIFLPHGRCAVRDAHIIKGNQPGNWVQTVPHYRGEEASLELAFSALSISRVGRSSNDVRLVNESNKLYGKALKTLQKALFDPKRFQTEHVLAACQLLGLYESFEGAGHRPLGWVSHAEGAARIMQLRGPKAHVIAPAHYLFIGYRVPIIYAAILRRRRTFMAEDDWLTTPWIIIHRTGMDELVDKVTLLPGLLEEFDLMKAQESSEAQENALVECLSRFREFQKTLGLWLYRRKSNAAPIVVDHDSKGEDDLYPFTHDIIFECHLFAGSNILHWSANLIISVTILDIELELARRGQNRIDVQQSTTVAHQEARKYATRIVQSVPYCLWPDMGELGINIISFPMSLAFKFFSQVGETRICNWLSRTCHDTGKMGLSLDPFGAEESQFMPTQESNRLLTYTAPKNVYDSVSSGCDEFNCSTSLLMLQHKLTASLAGEDSSPPWSVARRTSTMSSINPASDDHPSTNLIGHGPRQGTTDVDHDAAHDRDSEFDALSPVSVISHGSSATSAYGAASSVPRHVAQLQLINASKGEFTFVEEDPSQHYVVSDE